MESKDDLLMDSLKKFYKNPKNIKIFIDVVSGNKKISLRIIDWFVTNYAKKFNISYIKNKKPFVVFLDYKSQLKAYSKKFFDPFCRRKRIIFEYGDGKEIKTTVGQLNFFRWSIENGILSYIKKNLEAIEQDMRTSLEMVTVGKKTSKKRQKRKELSVSATKKINKHNVKIVLEFN